MNESQYSKAKQDSIVLAFTVSTIISVALAYVDIKIWWGKLIFEVISKIAVFLISWKIISSVILKIKMVFWAKKNRDHLIGGKWFVLHFSDIKHDNCMRLMHDLIALGLNDANQLTEIIEAHKNYIRVGSVCIDQKMDEVNFKGARNYTPKADLNLNNVDLNQLNKLGQYFKEGSSWCSSNTYRLAVNMRELSGTFNVIQDANRLDADGMHGLTVESSDRISGRFYNANCVEPKKPKEGVIMLFRNQEDAKAELTRLLNHNNLE